MTILRGIRWRPVDGEGLEHLDLETTAAGIVVRSVVVGSFDGFAFGARYDIELADDWTFRSLRLVRTDGAAVALGREERGGWTCNGAPAPHLAGCIDIDISGTPFTNTLPIRRANLTVGVPKQVSMAWIPMDTPEPRVDEQIYTKRDARHFRYQAADGSFEAELTVDEHGLVVDYPGLFRRA